MSGVVSPTHWNCPTKGDETLTIEQRWGKFWDLFEADGWEPETQALVRATLKAGDLFVDIGAWIGPVTLWALDCGAEAIAIEPDPVALAELRRRVPDEVEIHECALGVENGMARIKAASAWGDSMTAVTAGAGRTVSMRTLPEILNGRRPAMATMDIEGYEMTILPVVAPYLASLGTTLMVALHTGLPDPAWFADFSHVEMPKTARRGGGTSGRSLAVVAYP